ncbi:RNA methyltransferase [Reyranella sp. CPCC 100927]|uniref:TrmH family RNA methyltransferase n=1 Tax=Reyranella sp. CPCC 100927 TaxID=2599616 RepID=UPI0011B362BC|nr:RNA methyltransferase [Reyranella sp. CPCC 100927]TWT09396.1 RNA methyltransferase [Reyranella sp. CPCC 100927]
MVGRTRQTKTKTAGKTKKPLLASHQRSWLWGKNLVLETLASGRWPVHELYLADDLGADAAASELAQVRAHTPKFKPTRSSRTRIAQLCGTQDHQGYLARVGAYPYVEPGALRTRARTPALFLILDGVQDPFNLGAMLRSAEVFGVDGVFLGTQGCAGVNSLAARASAGAVNRLAIARVDSLPELIAELRRDAVRVVGTGLEADYALDACDLGGPTALVIGNEGTGLSPDVRTACNMLAKIPQDGGLNSLNAAAAAAVCLYETLRQRRQDVSVWGVTSISSRVMP